MQDITEKTHHSFEAIATLLLEKYKSPNFHILFSKEMSLYQSF